MGFIEGDKGSQNASVKCMLNHGHENHPRNRWVMLLNYIRAAMGKARYEILADDKSFYGEIPGFKGVYANASTLEVCREELEQVLEDWILLSVAKNLPLPVVDGIELKVKDVA